MSFSQDRAVVPAVGELLSRRPAEVDGDVLRAVVAKEDRQHSQMELLAPKNHASRATREAFASIIPSRPSKVIPDTGSTRAW